MCSICCIEMFGTPQLYRVRRHDFLYGLCDCHQSLVVEAPNGAALLSLREVHVKPFFVQALSALWL